MKLNIHIQIQMPELPNFLRLAGPEGTIDLGSFDDDAYAEFEEQYMEALRRHWIARRKEFKNPKT
jgi:Fe-S-cluster formation regulator IscX/YfhJ